MKLTLFFILFITNFTFTQKPSDFIPLSTIDPSASIEDLKQLDSIFQGKKLIGLGESTHGTSEFTTMRHRIFKYLVENHGFNTFFLEADYSACKRVNRYVHGAEDHVDSALFDVLLYPWLTVEMTVLIDWMREYNSNNGNILNFVGCDMQIIEDELPEVKLFLGETHPLLPSFKLVDSLLYGKNKLDSLNVVNARGIWNEVKSQMRDSKSSDWKLTQQGIDFAFNYFNKPSYNFRDSCMAENIALYMNLYPESKGVYFAHNFHVARLVNKYNRLPDLICAGEFLARKFAKEYYTIGFISHDMTFTTRDYHKNYAFVHAHRVLDDKLYLECKLQKMNSPIGLLHRFNFNRKAVFIGSFGATIGSPKGKIMSHRELLNNQLFDAYLFIDRTTPTKLLKYKVETD